MNELPVFSSDVYEELRAELGDDDTIAVLEGFLAETSAVMSTLDTSTGFRASLKRHAHVIKGTAATFGFMRLASTAKELELGAERAQDIELQTTLAQLRAAFDECAALAARRLTSGRSGADE